MTINFADDSTGGTTSMVTGDCSSKIVLGTVSVTFDHHVTGFYSKYLPSVEFAGISYITGLGVEFVTDDTAFCDPNT